MKQLHNQPIPNPVKFTMHVHKSYWIRILKDPSDTRTVKKQFTKDLGFSCPLKAAAFLEEAEQTTFIGNWFLTDSEVVQEEIKAKAGKLSVHTVEAEEDGIVILKNAVTKEVQKMRETLDLFEEYLDELSKHDPDAAEEALEAYNKVVTWAGSYGTESDGTSATSTRKNVSITLLNIIEDNADDMAKLHVLTVLARIFVHRETMGDWLVSAYAEIDKKDLN